MPLKFTPLIANVSYLRTLSGDSRKCTQPTLLSLIRLPHHTHHITRHDTPTQGNEAALQITHDITTG
jgi:hypothetical protein